MNRPLPYLSTLALLLALMGTPSAGLADLSPLQSSRSAATASNRTYDSVTDTTFITLKSLSLVDDAGQPTGVTLRVFASFVGGDVAREPVISLGWMSTSRNWQFAFIDTIILKVDGVREVKIGNVRHEWTTTMEGAVVEQVWAETTVNVLVNLGRASRVQGLLGKSTFVLNPEQIGALRGLAAELSQKTTAVR